jgi:hypothetical protein
MRSAFQQAISHQGRAIEIIDDQIAKEPIAEDSAPPGAALRDKDAPQWRSLEATVRADYARAVMLGGGFVSPQSQTSPLRALRNVERSQSAERFDANYVAWITHFVGGDMATASTVAPAFLPEADQSRKALGCEMRAANLRDRFCFFDDHEAATRINFAAKEWFFGGFEAAHKFAEVVLQTADAPRHPPTICAVRSYPGALTTDSKALSAPDAKPRPC